MEQLLFAGTQNRGCQMVWFPTKNHNLGLFLEGLGMENVGIVDDDLEYFTAICYKYFMAVWYSLCSFGIVFSVLV
jgi:hypothetical protein